jgi:hypothetical protein
MDIFYYPDSAITIEDRLSVGDIVKGLVAYSRKKKTFKTQEKRYMSSTCEECGNSPFYSHRLHKHHIKPIWVYALEYVMEAPPNSFEEYTDMVHAAHLGRIVIGSECHDPPNIKILCAKCHAKAESETNLCWKEYFTGCYRLVWSGSKREDHEQYVKVPDWFDFRFA